MNAVFVRVNKICGLPEASSNDAYQVYAKLIPQEDGSVAKFYGMQEITSQTTWSFLYEDQMKSAISLIVQKVNNREEIARVTLPLKWFEKNTVVKEEFPMLNTGRYDGQVLATVEVHISENGECPFTAPAGSLRVRLAIRQPGAQNGGNKNTRVVPPASMRPPPQPPSVQQPMPNQAPAPIPAPVPGPSRIQGQVQGQQTLPPRVQPGMPGVGMPGMPQVQGPPVPVTVPPYGQVPGQMPVQGIPGYPYGGMPAMYGYLPGGVPVQVPVGVPGVGVPGSGYPPKKGEAAEAPGGFGVPGYPPYGMGYGMGYGGYGMGYGGFGVPYGMGMGMEYGAPMGFAPAYVSEGGVPSQVPSQVPTQVPYVAPPQTFPQAEVTPTQPIEVAPTVAVAPTQPVEANPKQPVVEVAPAQPVEESQMIEDGVVEEVAKAEDSYEDCMPEVEGDNDGTAPEKEEDNKGIESDEDDGIPLVEE